MDAANFNVGKSKRIQTMPIFPPAKPKPRYMTRAEVIKLCRRHNLARWYADTVLCARESAARVLLTGRKYAVYDRAVVFDVLGLKDE